MRYMLLIYTDETLETKMSRDEQEAYIGSYFAFLKEAQARNSYLAAEALQPTSTATIVRTRNGKAVITDGPFAETKEQLAGFCILNCKDLDEAIEFAAKNPGAAAGAVEIRPIRELGQWSARQELSNPVL